MRRNPGKKYRAGDQIHFIVTRDFVESVNEFALFCDENSINFSNAIRDAMVQWYNDRQAKERRNKSLEHGTSSLRGMAERYERDVLSEVRND